MEKFVVGYLSFFENDLKLFSIQAESEYEAIKKAMIEACSEDKYKESEIEWQNSEDYPKDKDSLIELLYNSDVVINVLKI